MKIAFYGDSTQAGVSVWSGKPVQVEWTPAEIVGAFLDVPTVNLGQGGMTLRDATAPAFLASMAASDADLIVANWGINDAYLPGNTPAIHRARWEQVIAACGGRLVMQTPNPLSVAHGPILAALVAEQRKINCPRVDIHSHITSWYPQWQSHLSDGIHPNEIMYLQIGKLLTDGLRDLL